MKIHENPVFVAGRDSVFRRVLIHMHAGDLEIPFLDSEQRVVALDEWLHKARNAVILFDKLRILHLHKMLGQVCLRLRAQKA